MIRKNGLVGVGLVLCAFLFPGCTFSPPEVETTPAVAVRTPAEAVGELLSGIKLHTLENGLRIITLERHDLPIVTTMICYHVGSADEEPGRTGTAHFLEHMMFKGTDRYGKGEIDLITMKLGGYNNAYTWYDNTAYHFTVPSSQWKIPLAIDASRMTGCLLDANELEAERNVVIEERKQGLDNMWEFLDEEFSKCFWSPDTRGSGYSHPIIGYEEDISGLSRDCMREFYARHYVPSKATLIMVGDFQTGEVLDEVEKLFGRIPAGSGSTRGPPGGGTTPEPAIEQFDVQIECPSATVRVQIAFPTVRIGEADDVTLEVIACALGSRRSSRLHRRLVEEEMLATSARASNSVMKYGGAFYVYLELLPGADADMAVGAAFEEVESLLIAPLSEREIERAKNIAMANFIFSKETGMGLAEGIGDLDAACGYEYLLSYLDRIGAVTSADVERVAATYLRRDRAGVGRLVPTESESEVRSPKDGVLSLESEVRGWGARVARSGCDATATVERGHNPERGGLPVWRVELPNGLTLLILSKREMGDPAPLPIVSIDAAIDVDQTCEPEDKAGIAYLTAKLIDRGTRERSAGEIADAIEFVGGIMQVSYYGVQVKVLSGDLDVALDLLADILMNPSFPEEEVEKQRTMVLAEIGTLGEDADAVAVETFHSVVYELHPYSRRVEGTREALKAISRNDVVAFHKAHYTPGNTTIAVVGDVEPSEVIARVSRSLGGWLRGETAEVDVPELARQTESIEQRVEMDTEQVSIYLGHLGVTRDNPDFEVLKVMDAILGYGSGFTDRLSKKLRDEMGICYYSYATITEDAGDEPGTFTAYVASSPENHQRALEALIGEIRRFRDEGPTEEELADAKTYLTGSYVLDYESCEDVAGQIIELDSFGLGFDYPERFCDEVSRVTVEDVKSAAGRHIDPESFTIVIVGPGDDRDATDEENVE